MNHKDQKLFFYAVTHPQMLVAMAEFGGGFQKAAKAYNRNPDQVRKPVVVVLRPTYRCNFRCVMCTSWEVQEIGGDPDHPPRRQELTTDQWKAFLTQVAPEKPHVHFSGGEPLVRQDIIQLVSHAVSKNLFTSLNTNGSLLEERAGDLVGAGLHYLYVSIDGPAAVHEKIRGVPGGLSRTLRGIKAVIEARQKAGKLLPLIQVQTVIMPENHACLLETAGLIDQLGVDNYALFLADFSSNDNLAPGKGRSLDMPWKRSASQPPGISAAVIEGQVKAIMDHKWGFHFKAYPQYYDHGFDLKEYFDLNGPMSCRRDCHVPWAFVEIHPNGDVYGCSNLPVVVGNITRSALHELWRAESFQAFRRDVRSSLFKACEHCGRKRTF